MNDETDYQEQLLLFKPKFAGSTLEQRIAFGKLVSAHYNGKSAPTMLESVCSMDFHMSTAKNHNEKETECKQHN